MRRSREFNGGSTLVSLAFALLVHFQGGYDERFAAHSAIGRSAYLGLD